MKILIVDDDKIIRMGLTKKIKRLFSEHEVMSNFQNGSLALEYLREKEKDVDLVITDIKMPIMTGVELIKKSEEELHKPPAFIVLSGYDDFSYVRDSMKAGATNYLLKPIGEEELKKALRDVELKINYKKKEKEMINKSINVLRKDFFKHILFSNKDTDCSISSSLLQNMQLDEDYVYNMIVIERGKKDDNIPLRCFIRNILKKCRDVEYLFFYYENTIYVILYYNINIGENVKYLRGEIIKEADVFIDNYRNVYILESTEKVWKLREQFRLVIKVKETVSSNCKPKKYILNQADKLSEFCNKDKKNSNSIAIELAKKYIINNFNKDITLKDVAEEVYLSHNYLSELFKKEEGEGFYDFLSNYRIKKAKEILMTTNLKVYEIAEYVGYSDSITFGRAFKKITGTTPNCFRNSMLIKK
ncbi:MULTISPECIES: response regulator [Clostridium]|uniref:Stage 0 sporulation protein A homolog n=1 Tax=Clostridium cibarium TaxID=2762247 RepID=A0ABR8PSW2_9CLOT|nr:MULTISPECIES: response regulator [Clostridium]MBD7911267.1 response regulator [Clostridium cibarium]